MKYSTKNIVRTFKSFHWFFIKESAEGNISFYGKLGVCFDRIKLVTVSIKSFLLRIYLAHILPF